MSKAKDAIQELRNKVFEKKKQEVIEQAQVAIDKALDYAVYDVIQDPNTSSRSFLIVKLKYDLETKQAAIVEVRPFQDKAAGLTIQMDKESRKVLFERNKQGVKK